MKRIHYPAAPVLTLVLAIILLTGLPLAALANYVEEAPRPGFRAPRFEAPALDGTRHRLSELKGRTVLLNFWASWCPPCVTEMPDLDRLQAAFPVTQFTVVGLSTDRNAEAAAGFLRETPVSFPILLDERQRIMRDYGVRGLPTTFLIDAEGTVVEVLHGPREWAGPAWMEKIETMVGETAAD